MSGSRALQVMIALACIVLVAAAVMAAQSVIAPVVFAIFVIALVWPLQGRLQSHMPQIVAMLVTMLVALVTLVGMGLVIAWAFGSVGQWVVANAGNLQLLYTQNIAWLEEQGIPAASVFEGFDPRWMVRMAQYMLSQLQGLLTFILLTLVFVILGLLEVDVAHRQMLRLGEGTPAALLRAAVRTASKVRTYMLVRTAASVVTGLAVWAFAAWLGLELAEEWGAIALVLNYIPFIGPLVATVFPTVFAVLQFGTWEVALVVFLVLQIIQFVGGSYLEPRLTGKQLAVSPFMVLVAVFAFGYVWGMAGAFIGVPVLIAALTICEEFPETRWVAELFSGRDPAERQS